MFSDEAPDSSDTSLGGLTQAFAMIVVSEIGDKTFLIAAILAMRHPRLTVFAGAFGSLLVMSVLSAAMGRILPSLLPKIYTHLAASALFFVFGARMFREGREMGDDNEKLQEEMREAEEEIDIEEDDAAADGSREGGIPLRHLEEGSTPAKSRPRSPSSPKSKSRGTTSLPGVLDIKRNCRNILGPVLAQSFILTFLGEWGDRSQIATIALAAAHSMTLVAIGTVLGHACCTALAVLGGRWVSTKISIKKVTLGGAILFILFGFIYLFEAAAEWSQDSVITPVLR
ncbi:UPF0016-domain-containing protein [Clavulina sp. PMI_390]|nr:UPF0016-domain-containing protein [Clavulina sp. PMI_390]